MRMRWPPWCFCCLWALLLGSTSAAEQSGACAVAAKAFISSRCGSSKAQAPVPSSVCSAAQLGDLKPVLSLSLHTGLSDQYFARAVQNYLGSSHSGEVWDVNISSVNPALPRPNPDVAITSDLLIIPAFQLGDWLGGSNNSRLAAIDSDLMATVSTDGLNQEWYQVDAAYRLQSALYGVIIAGVPMAGSASSLLYYRHDILARLGIPVSRLDTWAGVLTLATALTGRDSDGDGQTEYGICWHRGGGCGAFSLMAIIAPFMQTGGAGQGFWLNVRTGQSQVNSSGMQIGFHMYQRLAALADPREGQLCGAANSLFMQGRCIMTISTDANDFKAYSQSNASRVRGKFSVVPMPGTDIVLDPDSGQLVPCDDTTCPLANLETTLHKAGLSAGDHDSPQPEPHNYTSLLGLDTVALAALGVKYPGGQLLGGPRVNRAPAITNSVLGVINAALPLAARKQALQLLAGITNTNASWDMVLAGESGVSPYRYNQWAGGPDGSHPKEWDDAGYDPVALPTYIEAVRRSSDWSANAAPEPQFMRSDILGGLGGVTAQQLLAGVRPSVAAQEITDKVYAGMVAVYGSWEAFLWEYRASKSYLDIPREKPSPIPPPTSTSASTHTVRTVLIATLVPTCVIAIALVWYLLMRNTRVHRDMLGRVIAPPVAPDTTMLVAVVQDLEALQQSGLLDTVARATEIWDTLTSQLLGKHAGYQLPTSSLGCLHAAFYTPGEAAMFALQLQRMLLVAKWPKQMLEVAHFSPLFMEPTDDSQKALDPDMAPLSPTAARMSLTEPVMKLIDQGDVTLHPRVGSISIPAGLTTDDGAGTPVKNRTDGHDCLTFGHQCASSWGVVMSNQGSGGSQGEPSVLSGANNLVPSESKVDSGSSGGLKDQVPMLLDKLKAASSLGRSLGSKGRLNTQADVTIQAGHANAVLVAKGLQVCVGLCAVCGSEAGRSTDPVTGRITFSGQPMQIAQRMAASGQAGMTLVPQQTFRQLPVEVMSRDNLFCHYGEYAFSPSLPPLDVYLALDKRLLGRLALFRPLALGAEGIAVSPGVLAAPVERAAMVFTHIVGVQTLLAWNYEVAAKALDVFTRLAQQELKAHHGYLVEHVSGFMLSAFQEPGAAILWALQLQELMLHEQWSEDLLAHEMCEEVIVSCDSRHAPAPPAHVPSDADSSQAGEAKGGVVLYRGPRLKTGIDLGPILTALNTVTGRMAYRGKVMNRAARIASIASSGQVLCSSEALNGANGTPGINELQAQLQHAVSEAAKSGRMNSPRHQTSGGSFTQQPATPRPGRAQLVQQEQPPSGPGSRLSGTQVRISTDASVAAFSDVSKGQQSVSSPSRGSSGLPQDPALARTQAPQLPPRTSAAVSTTTDVHSAQQGVVVQTESLGLFQLKGIVERIEVFHCFHSRPYLNVVQRRPSLASSHTSRNDTLKAGGLTFLPSDAQRNTSKSAASRRYSHSTKAPVNCAMGVGLPAIDVRHSRHEGEAHAPIAFAAQEPASGRLPVLQNLDSALIRRASWAPSTSATEECVFAATAAHHAGSSATSLYTIPAVYGPRKPLPTSLLAQKLSSDNSEGQGPNYNNQSDPSDEPHGRRGGRAGRGEPGGLQVEVSLDHSAQDIQEVMYGGHFGGREPLYDGGATYGRLAGITEGEMEGSPRSKSIHGFSNSQSIPIGPLRPSTSRTSNMTAASTGTGTTGGHQQNRSLHALIAVAGIQVGGSASSSSGDVTNASVFDSTQPRSHNMQIPCIIRGARVESNDDNRGGGGDGGGGSSSPGGPLSSSPQSLGTSTLAPVSPRLPLAPRTASLTIPPRSSLPIPAASRSTAHSRNSRTSLASSPLHGTKSLGDGQSPAALVLGGRPSGSKGPEGMRERGVAVAALTTSGSLGGAGTGDDSASQSGTDRETADWEQQVTGPPVLRGGVATPRAPRNRRTSQNQ